MLPKKKLHDVSRKSPKLLRKTGTSGKKQYDSKPIFEMRIIKYLFSTDGNETNKTSLTLALKINQTKLDEYLEKLFENLLVKERKISEGIVLLCLTEDGKIAAEEAQKLTNTNHPISRLSVFS